MDDSKEEPILKVTVNCNFDDYVTDCISENSSEYNLEMFIELEKISTKISRTIVTVLIMLLLFVFPIGMLYFGADYEPLLLCFYLFVLYRMLCKNIVEPKKIAEMKYEIALIINKNNIYATIRFYKEYLEWISGNSQKTIILYKNIIKMQSTKNMYVLKTSDDLEVIMRKDSFVKGTLEDVKILLV